MALFKIEKGLSTDLATNRPSAVEGYCYFTTDDGLFYIDTATGDLSGDGATGKRVLLNAGEAAYASRAYKDIDGNILGDTYATKDYVDSHGSGQKTYYTTITGNGGTSQFIVNHQLGSLNIIVDIVNSSGETVICNITRTDVNNITLDFNEAVPNGEEYTVLIIGLDTRLLVDSGIIEAIPMSYIGDEDGVAPLDNDGKIPLNYFYTNNYPSDLVTRQYVDSAITSAITSFINTTSVYIQTLEPTTAAPGDLWYYTPPPPAAYPGLCFTAEEAGCVISMEKNNNPPSINLSYSTDGSTWVDFIPETTTVTLTNVGDKVYFKGTNTRLASYTDFNYHCFDFTAKVAASGNIMSLLDPTCESTTISDSYAFSHLFAYCRTLTKAPSLPATTLSNYCYYAMFLNCENLETVPELPGEPLSESYSEMFMYCDKLKVYNTSGEGYDKVWKIPTSVTTSYDREYYRMFYNTRGDYNRTKDVTIPTTGLTLYTQNQPV